MGNTKPRKIQKSYRIGIAIALLLTLGIAAAFTAKAEGPIPTGEDQGGPWVGPFTGFNCPEGKLCAEWPVGTSIIVCCILPEQKYTHDFRCYNFLERRQRN